MNSPKILSQMVEQFRQEHNQAPREIVVAPVALLALGIKQSVMPFWDNVPVKCRLFEESEVVEVGTGTRLGVFVYKGDLRACELP